MGKISKSYLKEVAERKKYQSGGFTKSTDSFSVKQSNIPGANNGLFSNTPIRKGQLIGLAHENNQPVGILGSMHNHSENPNMHSVKIGNQRYLYADKDINPGDELTTNYRFQPELEQPEDFSRNMGNKRFGQDGMVKPIYTPDRFRVQSYQDSADLYNFHNNIKPFYPNLPQVDKNKYNQVEAKNAITPFTKFDYNQKAKDEKNNKVKNFEDYIFTVTRKDLDAGKYDTDPRFTTGENSILLYKPNMEFKNSTTLPDGSIKANYFIPPEGVYNEHIEKYPIYMVKDPSGNIIRSYHSKNNDFFYIDSSTIQPIEIKYYASDTPEKRKAFSEYKYEVDSKGRKIGTDTEIRSWYDEYYPTEEIRKYKKPFQPYIYADPEIVEKQKKLKEAGLYTGELDGVWGKDSKKGWKKYEEGIASGKFKKTLTSTPEATTLTTSTTTTNSTPTTTSTTPPTPKFTIQRIISDQYVPDPKNPSATDYQYRVETDKGFDIIRGKAAFNEWKEKNATEYQPYYNNSPNAPIDYNKGRTREYFETPTLKYQVGGTKKPIPRYVENRYGYNNTTDNTYVRPYTPLPKPVSAQQVKPKALQIPPTPEDRYRKQVDNTVYNPPVKTLRETYETPGQIIKEWAREERINNILNKVDNDIIPALDVTTDLMQIGNFVPNPAGQVIGKIGNGLGSLVDLYQFGRNLYEEEYGDAALNLASAILPGFLEQSSFRRNSKYLKPGQPLYPLSPQAGILPGGYSRVSYIEPFTRVRGMSAKNLLASRALLGTLGAETLYDIGVMSPKPIYNQFEGARDNTQINNVNRNNLYTLDRRQFYQAGGTIPKYVEDRIRYRSTTDATGTTPVQSFPKPLSVPTTKTPTNLGNNYYQQANTRDETLIAPVSPFPKLTPAQMLQQFEDAVQAEAEERQAQSLQAEREAAAKTKQAVEDWGDENATFTFPAGYLQSSGTTKAWKDMDWREKAYVSGRNLGSWNAGNWTDNINPVAMLGSWAEGLGSAPYVARQTDSVMPYVTGIGGPLLAGALGGLGTKSTGQFVNNLVNPLAGMGPQNLGEYFTKTPLKNAMEQQLSRNPFDNINATQYIPSSVSPSNLEELRRIYHNSERFLQPEESKFLHKYGHGNASQYRNNRSIYDNYTREQIDEWFKIRDVNRGQLPPPPPPSSLIDYTRPSSWETDWINRTRAYTQPVKPKKVINKSGLTKDEVLAKASAKDKDVISKMSETEFGNTVLKPTGEVVPYESQLDLMPYFTGHNNVLAMSPVRYSHEFNSRLDLLNDIIRENNKSGIEYIVKGLDENGNITFYTPKQTLPDGTVIPEGESIWRTTLKPGQWRGNVEDIASTAYFKSIPGIEMYDTTAGVFPPRSGLRGTPGTKAYESINEYLKKLDLGRVKPGFNSQTETIKDASGNILRTGSKDVWENFINSGRAVGFYGKPGTVYGTMKTIFPYAVPSGLGINYLLQNQQPKESYQMGGTIGIPGVNGQVVSSGPQPLSSVKKTRGSVRKDNKGNVKTMSPKAVNQVLKYSKQKPNKI